MSVEILFLLLTTTVLASAYYPIPDAEFTYENTMENLHDLVKIDALSVFDRAVRHNTGMLITATANDTVEFALTKCGRPLFTRFYGTKTIDYLTPEDVRNLHLRFVTDCIRDMPPEIRDQTIDITYISHAPIESRIVFQPTNHSLPSDHTVTFHNISAKFMPTVKFHLKAHSTNIYPIKLGALIESITSGRKKYLQMTVHSPNPINFYFSKCDFTITHFPNLTDESIVFDSKMVHFMDLLQNENCERWMWRTMEFHLTAGDKDTSGTIEFDAVNEHPQKSGYGFIPVLTNTLVILSLVGVIFVFGWVVIHICDSFHPQIRACCVISIV